jgi:hypothetical protein
MNTVINLKHLQQGKYFLFPAQRDRSNSNSLNIYEVLSNYCAVVVYAKPGFPDVHVLGYHECPEVELFPFTQDFFVVPPGLDLISADECGILKERLAFHAFYRDFFARTFNMCPSDDYLVREGKSETQLQLMAIKAHCQTLCQYHIKRYTQIKVQLAACAGIEQSDSAKS